MCPGVCKDRLADAFQRFGRIPIEKRRIVVSPDHAAFGWDEDPFWSAGGLIHDDRGRVLLIRHTLAAGWGNAWVTPGGRLEEGETTLDGLHREVREEVGLAVVDPILTRILQQTLSDGQPILFTRDWHPRETKHFKEFGGAWPPHCIQGTKGARFHPDVVIPKGAPVLSKGMDPEQDSYSGFQAFTDHGRDLESALHELEVDELFICGLATDYCVRATTLDGLQRGLTIRVLRDAIRGVDLKPGDSEMAIKEMRVHGAQFSETRGLARLLPKE